MKQAIALFLLLLAHAHATPLTLTRIAGVGDTATGSGMAAGVADGIFTNLPGLDTFSAPALAPGGHFAFSAEVKLPGVPADPFRGGIWGGVAGSLSTVAIDRRSIPGTDEILIPSGFVNLNESGVVVFGGRSQSTNTGVNSLYLGLGDATASTYPDLERIPYTEPFSSAPALLWAGPHIGFTDSTAQTNHVYDIQTKTVRPVSYYGMSANSFGNGVTLGSAGEILALTQDGKMIVSSALLNGFDATNGIFLVNGANDVLQILPEGVLAPGTTNLTIRHITSAAANELGTVVALVRLQEDSKSSFYDRSGLFAGPPTNVQLIAMAPAQTLWTDTLLLINDSNHIIGPGNGGFSIYTLPDSTNGVVTVTPVPDVPGENPGPSGNYFCFNARDQILELFNNYTNATGHLWLYSPGEGWTNVARAGEGLQVGNENISVTNISIAGITASDVGGSPTSLADDGKFAFTVNGSHVILADTVPQPFVPGTNFFWTGSLGSNWHATNSAPPTNWKDSENNPRTQPPGIAEPDAATVFIGAVPGETIVLDQQPTSIGSLTMSNGLLQLKEHLTLNQPSILNDLRMEAPNGALTVKASTSITNSLDWRTGTVDGAGPLHVNSLFFTNAGATTLASQLIIESNGVADGGSTLILSNGVVQNNGEFVLGTGTITNSTIAGSFQNAGLLRKEGSGDFAIDAPFLASPAFPADSPWGIEVNEGKLSLLDIGSFSGDQTNTIHTNATLELAGLFDCPDGGTEVFQGDGTLELGTSNEDLNLQISKPGMVLFNMGGHTANLNRGTLNGDGDIINNGLFDWRGGTIAGDTNTPGALINRGALVIDSVAEPRSLERNLTNSGLYGVFQQGSLSARATIFNAGIWTITRSADLLAADPEAQFVNGFWLNATPESSGVANVDLIFDSFGMNSFVVCGNPDATNPPFTLRFRGELRDYDAAKLELVEGGWAVGPNCTLDFMGRNVEIIGEAARVSLVGGDMPSLEVRENHGVLRFSGKAYATPGRLDNLSGGFLVVDNSVLTVNGVLANSRNLTHERTELHCLAGSRIIVAGDVFNTDGAWLENNGEILFGGAATLGGKVTGTGKFVSTSGSVVDFVEVTIVGSSPGLLTVIGSAAFASTATLSMELAGTQTNEYDVLSVSNNLSLNGTLTVNLLDDFRPAPGDMFPIVQAGSITGHFANATNGQRIATIDGYGSVVVNYTPTSVILSAFLANPNPPPTAPATLKLPTFDRFDGTLNLSITGSPGRDYILQTSTNLLNWSSLETNNVEFDGTLDFQVPPTADLERFFRALGK